MTPPPADTQDPLQRSFVAGARETPIASQTVATRRGAGVLGGSCRSRLGDPARSCLRLRLGRARQEQATDRQLDLCERSNARDRLTHDSVRLPATPLRFSPCFAARARNQRFAARAIALHAAHTRANSSASPFPRVNIAFASPAILVDYRRPVALARLRLPSCVTLRRSVRKPWRSTRLARRSARNPVPRARHRAPRARHPVPHVRHRRPGSALPGNSSASLVHSPASLVHSPASAFKVAVATAQEPLATAQELTRRARTPA